MSSGAHNVQAPRTNEGYVDKAENDASSLEDPSALHVRYVSPEERRETAAHNEASDSAASPYSATHTISPCTDRSRNIDLATFKDEPLQSTKRRSGRWGSNDLYDTIRDGREMRKALLKYDTGARAESFLTSQNPSRTDEVMHRSRDYTNLQHAPTNDDDLDERANRTARVCRILRLGSGENLAKR